MKLQTKLLMSIGLSLGVATTYTLRDATYQQLDALKKEIEEINAISNELITKGKKAVEDGTELSTVKVKREKPSKFVGEYTLSPETNVKLRNFLNDRIAGLSKFPAAETSAIMKSIHTETESLDEWTMSKPIRDTFQIKKAIINANENQFGSYFNGEYNDTKGGIAETRNFILKAWDKVTGKNEEVYKQNLHRVSSAMVLRKEKIETMTKATKITYGWSKSLTETLFPTKDNLQIPLTELKQFIADAERLPGFDGKQISTNEDLKKQMTDYPKEFVKNGFEVLMKVAKDMQDTDFPGKFLATKRLHLWNDKTYIGKDTLVDAIEKAGSSPAEPGAKVLGSLVYLKDSTDDCRDNKKVIDMFLSELKLFENTIERFEGVVDFLVENKKLAQPLLKQKPGIIDRFNDTYQVHLENAIQTLVDEYANLKKEYNTWFAFTGKCKDSYKTEHKDIANQTLTAFDNLQTKAEKIKEIATKASSELGITLIKTDAISKVTLAPIS